MLQHHHLRGEYLLSITQIECLRWPNVGLVVWLYWGFTSLQRYFSHIATWKQDITNLWKFNWRGRESSPGPLDLQAKSLTTRPLLLPLTLADRCTVDKRLSFGLQRSANIGPTYIWERTSNKLIVTKCQQWNNVRPMSQNQRLFWRWAYIDPTLNHAYFGITDETLTYRCNYVEIITVGLSTLKQRRINVVILTLV